MRAALLGCMLFACAQETEPVSAPAASERHAQPTALESRATRSSSALDATASPEMQRLRRALSRSPEGLRFERRGARLHIDVGDTFQTATVVVPDEAGHVRRACLDDASQLDRMLRGEQ